MFRTLWIVGLVCVAGTWACNRKSPSGKSTHASGASSAPGAATPAPPAGMDAVLWKDIVDYPANSVAISAFPKANGFAPILSWLRGMDLPGWPPCVGQTLDNVERYYMIQTELPDGRIRQKSTLVFYGSFEKDPTIACASKALSAFGAADLETNVKTEASLTTMTVGDESSFTAWSSAGTETLAVFDDDKTLVTGFLSAPNKIASNESLIALLADVDSSGDVWSAGTIDYSSNFLKIPSTGYDLSLKLSGDMKVDAPNFGVSGRARLHFSSAAAATKAKAALTDFIETIPDEPTAEPLLKDGTDNSSASVRAVLGKVLTVSVNESQLVLTFAADKPQVMVLMNAAMAVGQKIMGTP